MKVEEPGSFDRNRALQDIVASEEKLLLETAGEIVQEGRACFIKRQQIMVILQQVDYPSGISTMIYI